MNNRMTVSVAMAAYNGEKFISEQIESVLSQLKESDELVISINPSTDKTEKIVKTYQEHDCRIKVFECSLNGVLANFENAIRHCNNEIVFLSDQDDVWVENKIERQLLCFNEASIGGVCHGCKYIDADGKLMNVQPAKKTDREILFWEIVKKNPVQGSTLAFKRKLADLFLPFPEGIPMHDSWIGLWICKKSKLVYLSEQLLLYRQHEGTVTVRKHKGVVAMGFDRIKLLVKFLMK